jgi:hypothetical protein
VTYFCSLKLTHIKNTICPRAKEVAIDIIHAEGVRGDFPSSAPKARNAFSFRELIACADEALKCRGGSGLARTEFAVRQKCALARDRDTTNSAWWRITSGEQSRVLC